MKTKKTHKLVIARETLRALSDQDVRNVRGGLVFSTSACTRCQIIDR
jgi:hypothetical protein